MKISQTTISKNRSQVVALGGANPIGAKTMLEPTCPERVNDSSVCSIFASNADKLEDDMEVGTFAHGVILAAYCGCPIAALSHCTTNLQKSDTSIAQDANHQKRAFSL